MGLFIFFYKTASFFSQKPETNIDFSIASNINHERGNACHIRVGGSNIYYQHFQSHKVNSANYYNILQASNDTIPPSAVKPVLR